MQPAGASVLRNVGLCAAEKSPQLMRGPLGRTTEPKHWRCMRIALGSGTYLLCTACLWTKTTEVEPTAQRPALCVEAVNVYSDSSAIPGEFVRVAVISPRHSPDVRPSTERVRKALRKKAARLGANGIILPSKAYNAIDIYDGLAVYIPADSARAAELCGRA
jgi:hypothetical protein